MIYFTMTTSSSMEEGLAVQLSDQGEVEAHTTGSVLGVVMSSVEIDGVSFATKIYSAGGGGVPMILGADWDGMPSRFQFVNGQVEPITSGGDGWLVPSHPIKAKTQGNIVVGAIYQ